MPEKPQLRQEIQNIGILGAHGRLGRAIYGEMVRRFLTGLKEDHGYLIKNIYLFARNIDHAAAVKESIPRDIRLMDTKVIEASYNSFGGDLEGVMESLDVAILCPDANPGHYGLGLDDLCQRNVTDIADVHGKTLATCRGTKIVATNITDVITMACARHGPQVEHELQKWIGLNQTDTQRFRDSLLSYFESSGRLAKGIDLSSIEAYVIGPHFNPWCLFSYINGGGFRQENIFLEDGQLNRDADDILHKVKNKAGRQIDALGDTVNEAACAAVSLLEGIVYEEQVRGISASALWVSDRQAMKGIYVGLPVTFKNFRAVVDPRWMQNLELSIDDQYEFGIRLDALKEKNMRFLGQETLDVIPSAHDPETERIYVRGDAGRKVTRTQADARQKNSKRLFAINSTTYSSVLAYDLASGTFIKDIAFSLPEVTARHPRLSVIGMKNLDDRILALVSQQKYDNSYNTHVYEIDKQTLKSRHEHTIEGVLVGAFDVFEQQLYYSTNFGQNTNMVQVFDLNSGKHAKPYVGLASGYSGLSVCMNSNGEIIAGIADKEIDIWHQANRARPIRAMSMHHLSSDVEVFNFKGTQLIVYGNIEKSQVHACAIDGFDWNAGFVMDALSGKFSVETDCSTYARIYVMDHGKLLCYNTSEISPFSAKGKSGRDSIKKIATSYDGKDNEAQKSKVFRIRSDKGYMIASTISGFHCFEQGCQMTNAIMNDEMFSYKTVMKIDNAVKDSCLIG